MRNLITAVAVVLSALPLSTMDLAAEQSQAPPLCPGVEGALELDWLKTAVVPGPGVTNPRLLKSAKPAYTSEVLTGQVMLDARVDDDGRVRNVCVVRSLPGMDADAAKAAKEFVFEPGQKDGKAVPVIVRIEIAFNMRQKP